MKSLTKKKTKVLLIALGSALLATILVLSGVGIYFKINKKSKGTEAEVDPLAFSVDAWDGKTVNADAFNGDFAGRGLDTVTIDSAASFVHFVNQVNSGDSFEGQKVYLNTSIDLKGNTIDSIGNEENPFKGTFDGGFYTIKNAHISGNGLFGFTENAEINNVGLYDVNISATDEVAGGLIGKAINTNISNTFVRLGSVSAKYVGGLVGKFESTNGSHTISNSFVDSTINSNEFGGLLYEINTNGLIDNLVVVQQCYYTAGEAAVVKIDNIGHLLEDKVDNANEGFKPGWKYSAKYEDAYEWCDYKFLEGSNKLSFNHRIQSGFVKVYLTGSHYESVVVTSDGKPFDASNLSLAFKEADKHTEAEINLLVEKVFVEAEAKLENATDIKINALKDTTIVRGEGNKGGMFSATAESKISIGSSSLARSATNATITLDGGVEDPEKSSEEVGALVVSYGGDVEIGENVVIQNNVNNTIGYGGAVLVYNPENQPVIEASIENCYAEHAGGAICVIGKAPKSVGSIKNCSTKGKGGAIAILDSMDNSSSRKAMNALYANDKTISFMNDHMDGEDIPDRFTLTGGVDSFEGCSAQYGGAIYFSASCDVEEVEFVSGEGFVDVNDFTETTDKSAGRIVFRNNTAEKGGAIYMGWNAIEWFRYLYFENNTAIASSEATGGAIDGASKRTYQFESIVQSVFINNSAISTSGDGSSAGGAYYSKIGTIQVYDSYFEGNGKAVEEYPNLVTDAGGAIYAGGSADLMEYHSGPEILLMDDYVDDFGDVDPFYTKWISVYSYGGVYINNEAVKGGAIYGINVDSSDEFIGNTAQVGGAICAMIDENSRGDVISYSTFTGNTATAGDGGAIYCDNYAGHSSFVNNEATGNGGAVSTEHFLTYNNGTGKLNISGNKAGGNGGAIYSSATTAFEDSELEGGYYINTIGAKFENNIAGENGGALYFNNPIFIADSTFNNNYAYGANGLGGAVYMGSDNSSVSPTVVRSVFEGNTSCGSGGALYISDILGIDDCTFNENQASDSSSSSGGAVYMGGSNKGSSAAISKTAFNGNNATGSGGALYLFSSIDLTDCTFNNNTANASSGLGGAAYMGIDEAAKGTDIVNTTFDGNSAAKGGAIYQVKTSTKVEDSKFVNNKALGTFGGAIFRTGLRTMTICGNTFIANNYAKSGGGGCYFSSGTINLGTASNPWTGAISGNSSDASGGAILLQSTVTLNINGGTIGAATIDGTAYEGNTSVKQGGAIDMNKGKIVLNINAGTITENKAGVGGTDTFSAGAIYVAAGTLNINGGTISKNTATSKAGAINVVSGATLNMSAGTISENQSAGAGGAILVNGTVGITGGSIKDNISGGAGGGIYFDDATIITNFYGVEISGNSAARGGGVYIAGANIDSFGDLYDEETEEELASSVIKNNVVTENGGGIYIDANSTVPQISNMEIDNNTATIGGGIYIQEPKTAYQLTTDVLTISNNTANSYGGGIYAKGLELFIGFTNIKGNKIPSTSTAPYGAGLYVENAVAGDSNASVNIDSSTVNDNVISAKKGKGAGVYLLNSPSLFVENVEICNNDASASSGAGGGIYSATAGTTITLGQVQINENNAYTNGGAIYVANGELSIHSAELNDNTSANGSVIYSTASKITIGETGALLETISGNESKAGAIFMTNQSELTIENADFDANLLTGNSRGSAITAENRSKITMNGGVIQNGKAKETQKVYGTVLVKSGSEFTMNGGEIKDNHAYLGGAVYVTGSHSAEDGTITKSTFNFNGGTISGNETTIHGGAVYAITDAVVNMTGGTITQNKANEAGGAFCVRTNSTLTIDGGTIRENQASTSAVAHIISGSTVTMNNGLVDGNFANGRIAGGFNASTGTFILNGGTISNNHVDMGVDASSGKIGGGVYVTNEGYFEMNGGLITSNYLNLEGYGGSGANIFVQHDGIFTMNGGTISGNGTRKAANDGDGIATYGKTTIKGGTIENCYADNGSAIYSLGSYEGFASADENFYGLLVFDVAADKTVTIQNNIGDAIYATGELYNENSGIAVGLRNDPSERSIFYDEEKDVYFMDNGNGVYDEGIDSFEDENENGVYDEGEAFTDTLNYLYDESVDELIGELNYSNYIDLNKNGKMDSNEEFIALSRSGTLILAGEGTINFVGNQTGRAIYADVDIFMFTNATFENFKTDGDGGAVYCETFNFDTDIYDLEDYISSFENLTFNNNSAGGNGGAVYARNGMGASWGPHNSDTINITFKQNHADGDGGALYTSYFGFCDCSDTKIIFDLNTADGKGGAVYTNDMIQYYVEIEWGGNEAEDGHKIYATDYLELRDLDCFAHYYESDLEEAPTSAEFVAKDLKISGEFFIDWVDFTGYEEVVAFKILDGGSLDVSQVTSCQDRSVGYYMENPTYITEELNPNAICRIGPDNANTHLLNMPEGCVENYNDIVENKAVIVKTIEKPTLSVHDYYYNAQQHSVDPGLDSDYYEVVSGSSGTEVGNYELQVKPVKWYRWADDAYARTEEVEPATAVWSINYPCITVVSEGEFANGNTFYPKYGTKEIYDGPQSSQLSKYTNPTLIGYTIDSYYCEHGNLSWPGKDSECDICVDSDNNWLITEDCEWEVGWVEEEYKVTLDPNGATDDYGNILSTEVLKILYESEYYNHIRSDYYRDGYSLDGWYGKNLYNHAEFKNTQTTSTVLATDERSVTAKIADTASNLQPGATNWSSGWVAFKFAAQPNTKYTVSYDVKYIETQENVTLPLSHMVLVGDGSKCKSFTIENLNTVYNAKYTFTTGENVDDFKIIFTLNSSTVKISNIQIELGDTATAYEPYIGKIEEDTLLTLAQDHTIVAHWRAESYTVQFNPNNGTFTEGSVTQKDVVFGQPYGELPTVTKEGYTFAGWYGKNLLDRGNWDPQFGIDVEVTGWTKDTYETMVLATLPAGDYTLSVHYSVYGAMKIEIRSFDGNTIYATHTTDGDYGELDFTFYVPRTGFKIYVYPCLDDSGLEEESYINYMNWQLEAGTEKTDYEEYKSDEPIGPETIVSTSYNHTLCALFVPESVEFTVKYDGNGATSGEMEDSTFSTGATGQTLSANLFEKNYVITYDVDGQISNRTYIYAFTRWNTKADGSGEYYQNCVNVDDWSTETGTEFTLYAQWDAMLVLRLPTPTKTGYTFVGWADKEGNIVGVGGESYTPTEDITLTATWQAKTTTVTFKPNGGYHNLINNYDLEDITTEHRDWDESINGSTFATGGWYSGYAATVVNPQYGYHAHVASDKNGNHYFRLKTNEDYDNDTYGVPTLRYLATGYNLSSTNMISGHTYAVSLDVKRVSGNGRIGLGFNYQQSESGTAGFYSGRYIYNPTQNNVWETLTTTFTLVGELYSGGLMIIGNQSQGEIWVDNLFLVDITEETNKTKEVAYDSEFGELPVPFKEGFIFDGWYESENFVGEPITSETVVDFTTGKDYFAKWIQKSHNLKLEFTMDGKVMTVEEMTALNISISLAIDKKEQTALRSYDKDLDYGTTYQITKINCNADKFEVSYDKDERKLVNDTIVTVAFKSREYKVEFGLYDGADGAECTTRPDYLVVTSDGEQIEITDMTIADLSPLTRKSSDGSISLTMSVTKYGNGSYFWAIETYKWVLYGDSPDEGEYQQIKTVYYDWVGTDEFNDEYVFNWNIDANYLIMFHTAETFTVDSKGDEGVESIELTNVYNEKGSSVSGTGGDYTPVEKIKVTLKDGYELNKIWVDYNFNGEFDCNCECSCEEDAEECWCHDSSNGCEFVINSNYNFGPADDDYEIAGNVVTCNLNNSATLVGINDYYTIYVETSPKSYALDLNINIDGRTLDLTNAEDVEFIKIANVYVNVKVGNTIYKVGYDEATNTVKALTDENGNKLMVPLGTEYSVQILTSVIDGECYDYEIEVTEESENVPWLGKLRLENFDSFCGYREVEETVDEGWEEDGEWIEDWYTYWYYYPYNTKFTMAYDAKDESSDPITSDDINVINLNFAAIEKTFSMYTANDGYYVLTDLEYLLTFDYGDYEETVTFSPDHYNIGYYEKTQKFNVRDVQIRIKIASEPEFHGDYDLTYWWRTYEDDGWLDCGEDIFNSEVVLDWTEDITVSIELWEYFTITITGDEGVESASGMTAYEWEYGPQTELTYAAGDAYLDYLYATLKEGYSFSHWEIKDSKGNIVESPYGEIELFWFVDVDGDGYYTYWEDELILEGEIPEGALSVYMVYRYEDEYPDFILNFDDYYTVKAITTANTYTVTLDANMEDVPLTYIEVAVGGKYTGLVDASCGGYEFDGWFGKNLFNPEGTQDGSMYANNGVHYIATNQVISDFIYLTAGDYTYTVNNEIYAGKVHFFSDESEGTHFDSVVPTTETTNGISVSRFTVPQDCYIRNVFLPISTSSITDFNSEMLLTCEVMLERGTTSSAYEPYLGSEEITAETDLLILADHTLVAKWLPATKNIYFDPNDGEGSMDSITYTTNVSVKLSKNKFTKVGHEFIGWNTKADGSGEAFENEEEIKRLACEDLILYAQWSPLSYRLSVKFEFNESGNLYYSGSSYGFKFNITVDSSSTHNLPSYSQNIPYGTTYSITELSYDSTKYVWANRNEILGKQFTKGATSEEIIIKMYTQQELSVGTGLDDSFYSNSYLRFNFTIENVKTGEVEEFLTDEIGHDNGFVIATKKFYDPSQNYKVTMRAVAPEHHGDYDISYYGYFEYWDGEFNDEEFEIEYSNWDDVIEFDWNLSSGIHIHYTCWENYTITITGDEGVESAFGDAGWVTYEYGPQSVLVAAPGDACLDYLYVTVKEGYTFSHWEVRDGNGNLVDCDIQLLWFIDTDGDGWYYEVVDELIEDGEIPEDALPIYYITGDGSFYGQFEDYYTIKAITTPNQYVVSFDTDGGDEITETITVSYGKPYGELPNATRDGYAFEGWHEKNVFDLNKFMENASRNNATIEEVDGGYLITPTTDEMSMTGLYMVNAWGASNPFIADLLSKVKAGKTYTMIYKAYLTRELESDEESTCFFTFFGDGEYLKQNITTSSKEVRVTFTLTEASIKDDLDVFIIRSWATAPLMIEYIKIIEEGEGSDVIYVPVTNNTRVVTLGNHTLVAQWSVANYTLTFEVDKDFDADVEDYGTITGTTNGKLPVVGLTGIVENGNVLTIDGATVTAVAKNTTGANDDGYEYSFVRWEGIVSPVTSNLTIKAIFTRNVKTYNIEYIDVDDEYKANARVEYTIESEEFKLTAPAKDGYTFVGWTGTGLSEVTEEVTVSTGSFGNRTYTAVWGYTVTVVASGVQQGNEYVVTVDGEVVESEYKVQTNKSYTFVVSANLNIDEANNKYQILQIGVNGVNRTTSSAVSVYQPITISDITGHTTLSIDFVEAHKMSIAVKDMTNTDAPSAIYGFAIAQSSKNDVVKAGNDYIVPTNKNISFTVDSTPKGSDVYTYTGLILNEVTKLGVGGGSAGITSAIKTDNLDYADPDVATYEYTITAGTKVESLVVRVALSQNVSIPTGSVSIGKGRITLQSNDGLNFNRVIESDTTSVVLYAGTWTIILDQPESWDLEGLKEVFGENVTQNGDVYTVTIP